MSESSVREAIIEALAEALAEVTETPWSVTVTPNPDDPSAVKVRIEIPLWLAPSELVGEHD